MREFGYLLLLSFLSGTAVSAPAKPAKSKSIVVNPGKNAARTAARPRVSYGQFSYEEAKSLIVPDQKYWLRYEDEESMGRVSATTPEGYTDASFSKGEVERFRTNVQKIADYRTQVKNRCQGQSNNSLVQALDSYLTGLAAFNRKALPLVADISENNDQLVLVINRSLLVDAPVLTSRYLRFKKQRFKENMGRFLTADEELVKSMVQVAELLKVEISDEDWNRSYGLRDHALETISLWPRGSIFEATDRLASAQENVCVVQTAADRAKNATAQTEQPAPPFRAAE